MTFLAPVFLWVAAAAALGIIALHFLVTRQPRASVLPTARFVPDSSATATARDTRPADLLLMLLRVLVVLAAGLALAKPVLKPSKQALERVFLLDASRSVANVREAADSVTALYKAGDAIVVFDSVARGLGSNPRDSLSAIRAVDARGNISAGLIASLRAASDLRDKADSIELVIISPLLAEEHDAATDSIRKLWPGRARVVRIAARVDSASIGDVAVPETAMRSDASDPLAVSVSLASRRFEASAARIVRSTAITPEDSSWMISGNRALILWPIGEPPRLATPRAPPDQSGGVLSGDARVVSAFERKWTFPADSLRGNRVVARWVDGEPAAVEKKIGSGCMRSVAIPVQAAGDLVIRPEFVRLVEAIAAPCGDRVRSVPLAASVIASLTGGRGLAPGSTFSAREDVTSPLAPWLFGLALAAALAELLVRRTAVTGALR
jgi:hypothetical protein